MLPSEDPQQGNTNESENDTDTEDHESSLSRDFMEWLNHSMDMKDCQPSDHVVVIGDSNVSNFNLDSEEVGASFLTKVICKTDIKIADVVNTFDDETNLSLDDVKIILVHVGAYNFEKTARTDLQLLVRQYASMTDQLLAKCTSAKVIVSSVLPRAKQNLYQQEFGDVNQEIAEFNDLLRSYCLQNTDLLFLDNDESFVEDFEVCDHLYRIHGESGILLSRRGQEVLDSGLNEALLSTYFVAKLQQDYNVNVEN